MTHISAECDSVSHTPMTTMMIRMEGASSRPDHLPTLSAVRTSKLSLLVKSSFGGGAADAGNVAPSFCFSVPAILKLTVESLWTVPKPRNTTSWRSMRRANNDNDDPQTGAVDSWVRYL